MNSNQNDSRVNCIGKVLRILDDRTIIVSATNRVLDVDDVICVYEIGDTIFNLDGTELCTYEHIKDTLKVVDTNEYYSVCKKMQKKTGASAFAISPLLTMINDDYESLNVDPKDIEPFRYTSLQIKKGDLVKKK